MNNKLNQKTIEKLGYYVYLLKDPKNGEVFYVGKGKGNRINSHSLQALVRGEDKSAKIKRIRGILLGGRDLQLVVLRHGLNEKEAFEIEAAVLDLYSGTLTNVMAGHYSDERGMMTLKELNLKYQAEPVNFKHSAILITVNRYYHKNITADELYERTRSAWKMNLDNASKSEIVCSIYRGIIREVYIPKKWHPHDERKGRIVFEGEVAPARIRNYYIDKSVKHLIKPGSSNPIRYIEKEALNKARHKSAKA